MSVDTTIVEVVPDVTGLDRTFDYLLPLELLHSVDVGSRVRIDLNGRRVGAWIVAVRRESSERADLKAILASSGLGPAAEVVELCRWAARRWCVTKLRPFLVTASAGSIIERAPSAQYSKIVAGPMSPAARSLLEGGGGVLRLPPTVDQMPAVLSAVNRGPTIVVCPTIDSSKVLAARLRRAGLSVALMPKEWASARGGVDVTIGARSAAFAPCPGLAAAVILDEHEESLQEERMPTWHARDVLAERCRMGKIPLLTISPSPTVVGSFQRTVVAPPADRERTGWADVRVIDRSSEPPWNRSLLSDTLIEILRDANQRVACILNSKGLARMLACRTCAKLLRCESCESILVEVDEGRLDCRVCGRTRPRVCAACSSTSISRLRPGVTRLREEVEKAANRPVSLIDSSLPDVDDTRCDVFVGTSAVLHRVRRADVVAFLDFDRELLAPRFQAHEQAMSLLIAAARIVGPRDRKGRVLLQTTLGDHEVVRAAVIGNMASFAKAELKRREDLGLPPFSALAAVEGDGLEDCVALLKGLGDVVIARTRDGALIRATNHEVLCESWFAIPHTIRSAVRIEVDPMAV